MRIVDVIGDSRVKYLYGPLKNRYSGLRDVTVMSGAPIHRLSLEVSARARSLSPPDALVVMGGICSVTRRHPQSGKLSVRIPSAHHAVLNIMEQFGGLMAASNGWNPNMKVLICELFGVNLKVTNHLPGPYLHPHQPLVNNIVNTVNTRLAILNTQYQVITPATADICHDIDVNGGQTNDYDCLTDGCHPDSAAVNELACLSN